MAAGSIIVDLLMRTSSFETDTARAAKVLRDLDKTARNTGRGIRDSFAGNLLSDFAQGVARQLAELPRHILELVDSVAQFKDLEEVAGANAEALASLAVPARVAGIEMSTIADAAVKLSKNLTGVDDESTATGAALAALNIPIAEFKKLDPVERIDALAKAFNSFADGPEKAAVAVALFGKAGAEQLKLFKELEAAGGRQVVLTQAQIERADEFADAQARSAAKLRQFLQVAATEALPALTALTGAVGDVIKQMLGLDNAAQSFGRDNPIVKFAEETGRFLARLVDSFREAALEAQRFFATTAKEAAAFGKLKAGASGIVDAIANPPPDRSIASAIGDVLSGESPAQKAATAALEAAKADADKALQALKDFDPTAAQRAFERNLQGPADRLVGTTGAGGATAGIGGGKPRLKFEGPPKTDRDDPTKKLLDNEVRALQRAIDAERDLLQSRNRFLDLFNQQGLVSIRDYYDGQVAAIEEATDKQTALIDKQIAALRKYQSLPTTSKKDQAETEGKVNELLDRRADVIQRAGEQQIELSIRQTEDQRRFQQQVDSVNADVLELTGNLKAAAAIRFDQQNFDLVRKATAEGNQEALRAIEIRRKAAVSQAAYREEANKAALATDHLRNQEDLIAIQAQTGAATQIEALERIGQARRALIPTLEAEVQAQEAIARASGQPELIANAERARVELERLKAVADPLGDEFRDVFKSSLTDPLSEFIQGTISASEAFKRFGQNVLKQLADMAAKDIAGTLFGKEGVFGAGIGEAAGRVFGSGASAGGASSIVQGEHDWMGGGSGWLAKIFGPSGGGAAGAAASATQASTTAALTSAQTAATASATGLSAAETAASAAIGAASATSSASLGGAAATATALATAETVAAAEITAASVSTSLALAGLTTAATAAAAALSAVAASSAASSATTAAAAAALFDEGGFTGNGSPSAIAGVVHGGEYVFSAPTVRALGAGRLDALHEAAKSGAVRGFADGGLVPFGIASVSDGGVADASALSAVAQAASAEVGQLQQTTTSIADRSSLRLIERATQNAVRESDSLLHDSLAERTAETFRDQQRLTESLRHESAFSDADRFASRQVERLLATFDRSSSEHESTSTADYSASALTRAISDSRIASTDHTLTEALRSSLVDRTVRGFAAGGWVPMPAMEDDEHRIDRMFDDGGYTGDISVSQVAGAVHGGEFVFSAPATRRLGVAGLDALHDAAKAGRIQSLAEGGAVLPLDGSSLRALDAAASSGRIASYADGGFVAPMTQRSVSLNVPSGDGSEDGRTGGGFTQELHIHVEGAIDRRTVDQIAQEAYRQGSAAYVRGN